jgi:chromate transporter
MSAQWALVWANGWDLLVHFTSLSLLAIGGAITVVPDMHRYLVDERAWLSADEFNSSIALAQAAPGPNMMFVPLLGWYVGFNAPFAQAATASMPWLSWVLAICFALLALFAMLLPSSILSYSAAAWAYRNQYRVWVQAFKLGLAPVVMTLLLSTAWIMASHHPHWVDGLAPAALSLTCAYLVARTRIHLLWLLGAGGLFGALGWV